VLTSRVSHPSTGVVIAFIISLEKGKKPQPVNLPSGEGLDTL
jgi:hypothetical protein